MKKIFTILLFFCLISCAADKKTNCNYITDYYPKIYDAELQYQLENYDAAFNLYQEAFSSCSAKNTPIYNELAKYAEVCARLGKNELALQSIEKLVKNGLEVKWIQKDPIYKEVFNSEKGKRLVENYDEIRKEYLSGINLKLRGEIQNMVAADQKYRRNYDEADNRKMDSIDQIHEKRLIEIFESIGYPNNEIVGHYSIDGIPADIDILLLHTSDSIRMNYFVPKLKEFVKAGKCSPIALGTLIDQYYLYNNELQVNGTYNGGATTISDLQQVDKNRTTIGLPPLQLQEKIDRLKQG